MNLLLFDMTKISLSAFFLLNDLGHLLGQFAKLS